MTGRPPPSPEAPDRRLGQEAASRPRAADARARLRSVRQRRPDDPGIRQPARLSGPFATALPWLLPLAVGITLWGLSLRWIDIENLTDHGLPPVLPIVWYVGLGVLLLGAVGAVGRARFQPFIAAAYLFACILVLYGTLPLILDVPHYPWVYKHIGVVRYIELHGGVDIDIDIYHRWPGFFAGTAVFDSLAGRPNPVTFAAWAEVFFTSVDALLVWAITRTLLREPRIAAGAALVFVVTNWVGQDYFAPQALGRTLGLALYLVLLRQLLTGAPRAVLRRIARSAGIHSRRPPLRVAAPPDPTWPLPVAVGIVLFLDGAAVVSHQLTPYLVLFGVGALVAAGLVRPWWVVVAMAGLTIAYLVPHFDYIQAHFGVFTSLDPFENARSQDPQIPSPGKLAKNTGLILTGTVGTVAGIGALRRLRRGVGQVLPFILLSIAPGIILFGQSYGGEGILRAILFSLPWCAPLVCCAVAPPTGPWRRRHFLAGCGILLILTALFIPAFFGKKELDIMRADEIQAGDYLYAHARPESVAVLTGATFPVRYGARYPEVDDVMLTDTFGEHAVRPSTVNSVADFIGTYPGRGYLVFSTSQEVYNRVYRTATADELRAVETAVRSSPRFRLWYATQNIRIYELTE